MTDSMELNCSPVYLRQLIGHVMNDYQKNHGNIPPKLQELFNIAIKISAIPRQPKHGKRCSKWGCQFKMHCKTIRCPWCHHPQRKRKKQTPSNNNN